MKKPWMQTVSFLLLMAVIAGFTFFSFFDDETVSMRENRNLSGRPEFSGENWFSGEFATGFESFLSDHVFERDSVIDTAHVLEDLAAKEMEVQIVASSAAVDDGGAAPKTSGVKSEGKAEVKEEEKADGETESTKTDTASLGIADDEVTGERLILNDRIVGSFVYESNRVEEYVNSVNLFFNMFPDYMTKAIIMVPKRIAFEEPEIAKLADPQLPAIEQTYSLVDPTVIPIDVYSVLKENSARLDNLYFRTDHHWTHFASYLAAKQLFDTLGQPFKPIDKYQKIIGKSFLGYYYAQNHSESIKNHPDELIYYIPTDHDIVKVTCFNYSENGELKTVVKPLIDASRQGYYSFHPSGTDWSAIEGANPDGPSIMLLGDSYTDAFVSWLAENSKSVVKIDPRDYPDGREGLMKIVDEYGINEVVVCDFTDIYSSSWFIGEIESLTE